MAIRTKRVVSRLGQSPEIPALIIGEFGWDVDKKTLRVGDGTVTPTKVMTTKSTGYFEYNNLTYVQFPEIRMLPEGTVDGVDISDLNAANGIVVRRGNNLWAHRTIVGNTEFFSITNGDGVNGNPTFDFSVEFKARLDAFLSIVYTDNATILGDGRAVNPLYAVNATTENVGVTETATEAETLAGVDTFRYVTPFLLKRYIDENGGGIPAHRWGALFQDHLGDFGSSGSLNMGSRKAFFVYNGIGATPQGSHGEPGKSQTLNLCGTCRIFSMPVDGYIVDEYLGGGGGNISTTPLFTGQTFHLCFKKNNTWYIVAGSRAIKLIDGNSIWWDGMNDGENGYGCYGRFYEAIKI